MKIQFVNHSSFIIHTQGISLMCDFWKDGSAFDNGWQLLCETEFDYTNFETVTHLWFSHEHPDHFSPPNLSAIPEALRNRITILFQETQDKRVVSFCKKLNFASVVELQPYAPITIAEGLELICAPYGASFADVDSWLCVRTPHATLLNINDCEFETDARLDRIRSTCGPIDFLATQFSFASKQGDKDDTAWIGKAQKYHLDKLRLKVSSFTPTYTLPFASFVYWSHIENRYLNEGIIKVDQAASCISECGSTPIVMYPQDEWQLGDPWDNQPALDRYAARYERLATLPESAFSTSAVVDNQTLINESRQFLRKMTEIVGLRQIQKVIALQHSDIRQSGQGVSRHINALWSGLSGRYEHSKIYVEDQSQSYEFSLEKGLEAVEIPREQCHISLSSAALKFCFSVAFGGESLQVNGRFQNITKNGWQYFRCVLFLARRIEQKIPVPKFVLLTAVLRNFGIATPRSEISG